MSSNFSQQACLAALTGLLADHRDHADERQYVCQKCGQRDDICQHAHQHAKLCGVEVYRETCEETTARLAVAHAKALIIEMKRNRIPC